MSNHNRRVDWARVERLFRAGVLSVCEIARECACHEANIRYHAKKNGWERDLTDQVRKSTRTKLVQNLAKGIDNGKTIVSSLVK